MDVQEQASCDAVKLGLICQREVTEASTVVLHIPSPTSTSLQRVVLFNTREGSA